MYREKFNNLIKTSNHKELSEYDDFFKFLFDHTTCGSMIGPRHSIGSSAISSTRSKPDQKSRCTRDRRRNAPIMKNATAHGPRAKFTTSESTAPLSKSARRAHGKSNKKGGMEFKRYFSKDGTHPFDQIEWESGRRNHR